MLVGRRHMMVARCAVSRSFAVLVRLLPAVVASCLVVHRLVVNRLVCRELFLNVCLKDGGWGGGGTSRMAATDDNSKSVDICNRPCDFGTVSRS